MPLYQDDIKSSSAAIEANGSSWDAISAESIARIRAQNKFKTDLEITEGNL